MKKQKIGIVEKLVVSYISHKIFKHLKNYISMKSWRTTLGGAIGALGTYLLTVNDPAYFQFIGMILNALGMMILGLSARDNRLTSEDVGAKDKF